MERARVKALALAVSMLAIPFAEARSVIIGQQQQANSLDTKMLGDHEYIAVWMLPKLGLQVQNDPQHVRLSYAHSATPDSTQNHIQERELSYTPQSGWQIHKLNAHAPSDLFPSNLLTNLPEPQQQNGSLYVPLQTLLLLGVPFKSDEQTLYFASSTSTPKNNTEHNNIEPVEQTTEQPAEQKSTPNVPIAPIIPKDIKLQTLRVNHEKHRSVEVERLVLELSKTSQYQTEKGTGYIQLTLTDTWVDPQDIDQIVRLPSGAEVQLTNTTEGLQLKLSSSKRHHKIFTLQNPARLVIDSTAHTNENMTPPINPNKLPQGVKYDRYDNLHLLSFDPKIYRTEVVSAPLGEGRAVSQLVKQANGVAGINGGYFVKRQLWPVDLVVQNGLMIAGSLEKRATLGFTQDGQIMLGYPKPRYILSGERGRAVVNSVRNKPDVNLLTAFVGNGKASVGTHGLTTIYIQAGKNGIQAVHQGKNTPPERMLAFTFDPHKFPQIPTTVGTWLDVFISWRNDEGLPWGRAHSALGAGPLLIQDGKLAFHPEREQFTLFGGALRTAQQSAYGLRNGKPTLAYWEWGSAEHLAKILLKLGFSDAIRLDSGNSSTVYVKSGGYGPFSGYLNRSWGRKVANALVLIPRQQTQESAQTTTQTVPVLKLP